MSEDLFSTRFGDASVKEVLKGTADSFKELKQEPLSQRERIIAGLKRGRREGRKAQEIMPIKGGEEETGYDQLVDRLPESHKVSGEKIFRTMQSVLENFVRQRYTQEEFQKKVLGLLEGGNPEVVYKLSLQLADDLRKKNNLDPKLLEHSSIKDTPEGTLPRRSRSFELRGNAAFMGHALRAMRGGQWKDAKSWSDRIRETDMPTLVKQVSKPPLPQK